MFQNKIMVVIGSLVFFFLINMLASCNSAFTGSGTGGATLTINLLGGGAASSVRAMTG